MDLSLKYQEDIVNDLLHLELDLQGMWTELLLDWHKMCYWKHCPITRVRDTKADDAQAGALQASVTALGALVGINLCSASSATVHRKAYSFCFPTPMCCGGIFHILQTGISSWLLTSFVKTAERWYWCPGPAHTVWAVDWNSTPIVLLQKYSS